MKYIGIKLVEAEPMTRGAYNEYRGWTIPENENPDDGGYLVKYSGGYESWCPKNQFEESNTPVGESLLTDTVPLMTSADYKDRFRAEYHQLVYRFRRLIEMLDKWDKGQLDFVPTCPRSTYNIQVRAMSDYIAALEARAMIENVQL